MNSKKIHYKVDTVFMNLRNSKTSDLHRLILNLSGKRKSSERGVIDMLPYQILSSAVHENY